MKRSAIVFVVLSLFWSATGRAIVVEAWTRASFQLTNLGRAEASATATGLATLTTSSSTSTHLSTVSGALPSALSLNASIPVTDPTGVITAVVFTSIRGRPDLQGGGVLGNISGAIAGTATGILPNTIPASGGVTFCLLIFPLPPCVGRIPLQVGGTSGSMRIGMGVGGILTVGGTGTGIQISLVGAPYTVRSVSVANRTANGGFDVFVENGFAHGPISLTSSTAQASGVLQVVTATHLVSDFSIGLEDVSGSISRIVTHYVPEPGLALLFGAGGIGVAWLGRRRTHE